MQPNYYLLRDNLESGPYTIDELLLQRLSPSDLVWVEGRTHAWVHPSELEELTVSFSINRKKLDELKPRPQTRRSTVPPRIKGKDEIETRAEEIRKKVLSEPVLPFVKKLEIREEETPSTYRLPEEAIDLVVHRRKIRLPGARITAMGIMLVFIAGAWYGKDLWTNNSRFLDAVARPFNSTEVAADPVRKQPILQQNFSLSPLPSIEDSSASAITRLISEDSSAARAAQEIPPQRPVSFQPVNNRPEKDTPVNTREPVAAYQGITEKIKEPEEKKEMVKKEPEEKKEPVKKEAEEKKEPVKKEAEKTVNKASVTDTTSSNKTEEASDEPQKKKSLGQAIKGLFKKKKKNSEEENE